MIDQELANLTDAANALTEAYAAEKATFLEWKAAKKATAQAMKNEADAAEAWEVASRVLQQARDTVNGLDPK